MSTRRKKTGVKTSKIIGAGLCYVGVFAAAMALMVLGSQKEYSTLANSPIISALNDSNFVVTADQLSESYIVADIANTFSLPTVASVNENYTSIAMKYSMAGTTETGVIEKPNIIDTSNLSRGIKTHIVVEGEDLDTLAARYGVTADQIRWSNNMKDKTLSVEQRLYIPPVPGILYTVKDGDTLEGLAEKYGADIEQAIIYNDLETSGLVAGVTIILPNGELPEKERPEYVAPAPRPTYSYSYISTDSGSRHNMREIGDYAYWRSVYNSTAGWNNPGAFGNCTWFAWYWRRANMPSNFWIPNGMVGNAGTWTYMSWSSRFLINKTPSYGAVVQTSTGSPGHVGVVVGVNWGVSITIQEMNYSRRLNRVYESTVNWSDALRWNYIHGLK